MHLQPHLRRGAARALAPWLAALLAALLAGCGGSPTDTSGASPQQRQAPTRPVPTTVKPLTLTPDQLMDWAEANLGTLFPPTQPTVNGPSADYRRYPQTGNTVGITFDRRVYVQLAGIPDSLNLGPLANYACLVLPACGLPSLQLLAGADGGVGYQDGPAAQARFHRNTGVAVDRDGNVYVADRNNNAIRKITPSGLTTTLAGNGNERAGREDGSGSAARFNHPSALALAPNQNLYVLDSGNGALRLVTPAGAVSSLSQNVSGAVAVAVDGGGTVYVAGPTHIDKIPPSGGLLRLAGNNTASGNVDAIGTAARFANISSLAADAAGNLYVFDNYSVRKVTPTGATSTVAGRAGELGNANGPAASARFGGTAAIALGADGTLYITQDAALRQLGPDGMVSTVAGLFYDSGDRDGNRASARFDLLNAVAADAAGNLYVSDLDNANIRRISPAGTVTTLAGPTGTLGTQDGSGTIARFRAPKGVAGDAAGNLYVADTGNRAVRKISADGTVTTLVAGPADPTAAAADGVGAAGILGGPSAMVRDADGNLYVLDGNAVRKITPAGALTTLAGHVYQTGSADGPGTSARFYVPGGLALDRAGNLYVSEVMEPRLRKISPAGVVTTLLRGTQVNGKYNMLMPRGLAVDAAGNLFVADTGYGVVLKLAPNGTLSTVAGSAGLYGSIDGYSAIARFSRLDGMTVDDEGTLYVVDSQFSLFQDVPVVQTVRRVQQNGEVTTLAGQTTKVGLTLGPVPGVLKGLSGITWAAGRLALASDHAILAINPAP